MRHCKKCAGYIGRKKQGIQEHLDPLASGLLPICLGEATKFSHYLLDSVKRYQTTIQLGHSTTTGDVEGEAVVTAGCTCIEPRVD